MATTTTNYGFTVPTSSDLVKNGATAISTLGQNVDTFLFRPFTRNVVINGGMDVWARGASGFGTSTGTYTADRWVLGSSSTTVARDTDVPVSPYFQYSMKMVGTGDNSIIQKVESANSSLIAGQTVTFSFYAKRTAGAGALDVRFYYPSAVDNFATTTQIGSTSVLSASPSSSWTRYSVSVAIGTNITAGLQILINNTGASTTFITGAQLEIGSQASPFTRAGGNIAGELAMCQRYYFRNSGASTNNVILGICGSAGSATTPNFVFQPPVTMRVTPTSVDFANIQAADQSAGYALSAVAINSNSQPNVISITATASGLTAYRPLYINASTASAYLGFSAEL